VPAALRDEASLLVEAVGLIDEPSAEIERERLGGQTFHDTQGDLYEVLLSEIATVGTWPSSSGSTLRSARVSATSLGRQALLRPIGPADNRHRVDPHGRGPRGAPVLVLPLPQRQRWATFAPHHRAQASAWSRRGDRDEARFESPSSSPSPEGAGGGCADGDRRRSNGPV
jgi:hypothetical protein